MKIAYLILAHNNPVHLVRLTSILSASFSSIFIHIDRKSNLDYFGNISGANIHVLPNRIPVYWGDFSQVEATLALLRAGLADERHFDYFVLLSGADYPIQSSAYIRSFFERNLGHEFIDIVPMGADPGGKSISRLTNYTPRPSDPRAIRFAVKLARLVGRPLKRDYKLYLGNLVPYGGSTWWALSREACQYVEAFVNRELEIVEFFKRTRCPDESFVHTILGNSFFKGKMLPCITYADWSARGSSPADLTEEHLIDFESDSAVVVNGVREVLFARKLSDLSDITIKEIDRLANGREERRIGAAGRTSRIEIMSE